MLSFQTPHHPYAFRTYRVPDCHRWDCTKNSMYSSASTPSFAAYIQQQGREANAQHQEQDREHSQSENLYESQTITLVNLYMILAKLEANRPVSDTLNLFESLGIEGLFSNDRRQLLENLCRGCDQLKRDLGLTVKPAHDLKQLATFMAQQGRGYMYSIEELQTMPKWWDQYMEARRENLFGIGSSQEQQQKSAEEREQRRRQRNSTAMVRRDSVFANMAALAATLPSIPSSFTRSRKIAEAPGIASAGNRSSSAVRGAGAQKTTAVEPRTRSPLARSPSEPVSISSYGLELEVVVTHMQGMQV